MTREEAIEILKDLWRTKHSTYLEADIRKALEMAIKALSQEPCQLLIIKSDILLHPDDTKKWMDNIKRGKEDGVIILPPYFEPLLVPADIEINIEQEPCDDVISRQAVIKLFNGNIGSEAALILHKVKQLPSVTQKSGKWIPVSERLPEAMDGTNGECSDDVLICVADYEQITISTGFYGYYPRSISQQGWWSMWAYGCHQLDRKYKVIAWMPLPKPYEPQESEKVNCKSTKCENCTNHNYCDYEPQESEDKE